MSTRQLPPARCSSKLVNAVNAVITPILLPFRFAKKAKVAIVIIINATAEGIRDVASVTAP